MLDLGARYEFSSYLNSDWMNPKLNSEYGWAHDPTIKDYNKEMWIETSFPNGDDYYVNKFVFQKRGDIESLTQYPNFIKIRYIPPGSSLWS